MSVRISRAAAALVAVLLGLETLVILPHAAIVVLVTAVAWFALPGVLFVYRALGSTVPARHTAWLVGPALGFGLSGFGLLLVWAAGVPPWPALVVAPLFTVALAWLVGRFGGARLRLPALDRRDAAGVACALLVVPLITFAPYARIKAPVADGEAYRAYFTADFIWAMSVTAEISKGQVPPDNPFHHGEPMRYYWMSHLLSGVVYRAVQPWGVGTEPVVLVNGLAFGMAFTAFLYWLVRSVGGSTGWATAAVIVGFVANSYEGADMLRAIIVNDGSWQQLRETNIDAVTRWFYNGMAVDGLQRLLLYQPHHLTGYVLALAALWLAALAERVEDVSVALWTGILLGLAFLFSTFGAIILGVAIALTYAVRLVQQGALKWALHCVILGAAPLAIAISLAQTLGYTNPADGLLLEVGSNPVALRRWPYVIFLSFGPLLICAVAGLLRVRWVAAAGLAPAALVVTSFAFYFLTDVPDMGGVWVGWRSGHMLLIAFTAIAGAAMTAWWSSRRLRYALMVPAIVLVALAVPTVAIDVFNAQDIDNRAWGAGFPWTLVITSSEREGLEWIRANTPETAIVQPEPFVRDPATWAYVPAFAQRRMAAGLPISMIPLRPYQRVSEAVRSGIFKAGAPEEAYAAAADLRIDYLLIGAPERRTYRAQVDRLIARPDLFPTVFRNDAIAVLRVMGPSVDSARRR